MNQSKPRILVVDDEPDVLQAIETSLSLSGYTVVAVSTPDEALKICEQQPIDLAVIDFILKKMDGLELLARIRQVRPLIRSIIISGKIASPTDPRQISEVLKERVQADAYLEKPVAGSELEKQVAALLADVPSSDWKEIGKRMVSGQNAKIKSAAEAARALKKYKRK
jgi:CheY-like chemotaxis protein